MKLESILEINQYYIMLGIYLNHQHWIEIKFYLIPEKTNHFEWIKRAYNLPNDYVKEYYYDEF